MTGAPEPGVAPDPTEDDPPDPVADPARTSPAQPTAEIPATPQVSDPEPPAPPAVPAGSESPAPPAVPAGSEPPAPQAAPARRPFDWEGRAAVAARGPMGWGVPAFVLGFGLFYLASLVVAGVLSSGTVGDVNNLPSGARGPVLLLVVAPNLLIGLVPLAFSLRRGQGPRRDFGLLPTARDLRVGVVAGLAALVIGLVLNFVLLKVVFHQSGSVNEVQQLGALAGGRSVWLVVTAAYLALGAPVMEEMAVRGALWGALEHHRVNRYAILGLTALVFALMHQEPTLTLPLFCQGVAIGTARLMTGRIGSSMIAHATNNLIPALVLIAIG
jgi:uncharacterized protein